MGVISERFQLASWRPADGRCGERQVVVECFIAVCFSYHANKDSCFQSNYNTAKQGGADLVVPARTLKSPNRLAAFLIVKNISKRVGFKWKLPVG